jgi:DinB superfamily
MSKNANLAVGLIELATQVRTITVRQLEVSEGPLLTWAPRGTSNHILWHAGHALWVADVLTIEPITGRGELPNGWENTFGEASRPGETIQWPRANEVCELLKAQIGRVQDLFRLEAESIIARASEPIPQSGWPLLRGIIHGWHDEARHQGEMHLLTKLYRNRHT